MHRPIIVTKIVLQNALPVSTLSTPRQKLLGQFNTAVTFIAFFHPWPSRLKTWQVKCTVLTLLYQFDVAALRWLTQNLLDLIKSTWGLSSKKVAKCMTYSWTQSALAITWTYSTDCKLKVNLLVLLNYRLVLFQKVLVELQNIWGTTQYFASKRL